MGVRAASGGGVSVGVWAGGRVGEALAAVGTVGVVGLSTISAVQEISSMDVGPRTTIRATRENMCLFNFFIWRR